MFDGKRRIAQFKDFPIVHGFSTTKAGNMSYKWGPKATVSRNLKDLYQRLALDMKKEAHILPEFGPTVEVATKENQRQIIKCDGLVTTRTNLPLGLCPADCLPIVLTTNELKFVGLVHAGRNNLIEYQIVEKAIKKIEEILNISPKEILVGIGPGIGRCHYDIDLYFLTVKQLKKAGISKKSIRVADVCTYCSEFEGGDEYIFFSHRRAQETGEKEGRFAAIVALKPVH